jgi:hypothetical protein
MKVILSEKLLYNLLFSEKKSKSELEGMIGNLIKKNVKLYISIESIKNAIPTIPFENSDRIAQNLEIICEMILPLNLEIFKLSLNYSNLKVEYPMERATAGYFGLDKILDGEGNLISIIGFRTESNHY